MTARAPLPAAVRAVVLLCGAVVLVDTVFYAVLSPLLAGYAQSAALDRSAVGLLVAAYPLGMAAGSVPAGMLASRRGPRLVLVTGALLTAVTCVLFATATSGSALVGFRLLQGVGGAMSWTAALVWIASVAPAHRRGEVIGRLLALSVVGGMLGPVVGAAATVAGTLPVFGAIAALCTTLAVVAARRPAPVLAPSGGWDAAFALLADRRVRLGLWLTATAGVGFGVVNSSAPLSLGALGLTALGTSAVFLAMAGSGALASPWLGRLADRRGRAWVAAVLLLVAGLAMPVAGLTGSLLLLVPVLVVAATSLEGLYVPGGALIVDGTADADVAGGEILAFTNLVWASSMAVASVAAGVTASVVGAAAPYLAVAVAALATLPFLRGLRRATPVAPAAAPGRLSP
ncbi:MAG: MFS transporter [Candidatus Nanopelagicales bacterium]